MERIAWGVALLGLLFRLLHWPFGGLFTVLGFSTVAFLYFPLGWLVLGRPSRKDQLIPLSVVTGIVLSLLCTGMLFKIQFWPQQFAELYLLIGLLGAAVVLAAVLSLHSRNLNIETYFKGLRHRLLLIALPALFLYLVPTPKLIQFNYRSDPERAALMIRLNEAPGDTAAMHALDQLNDPERSR